MAELPENSLQNKSALKIPAARRRSSSKSQTGSESSEIVFLSGDESWGSSGFKSGQTSDLGKKYAYVLESVKYLMFRSGIQRKMQSEFCDLHWFSKDWHFDKKHKKMLVLQSTNNQNLLILLFVDIIINDVFMVPIIILDSGHAKIEI